MNTPLALLRDIREQRIVAQERNVLAAQRARAAAAAAAAAAVQAWTEAQARLQALRSPATGMANAAMNPATVASSQAHVEQLQHLAMTTKEARQAADADLAVRLRELQRRRRAMSRLDTWQELDDARARTAGERTQALLEEEWRSPRHAS